jgi:hypothetical protein
MLEIIVNCNEDAVFFKNYVFHVTQPLNVIDMLQKLFDELIEYQDNTTLSIQLVKIDEDTRTIVGEW